MVFESPIGGDVQDARKVLRNGAGTSEPSPARGGDVPLAGHGGGE